MFSSREILYTRSASGGGRGVTTLFIKELSKSLGKLWLAICSIMLLGGTILMPVHMVGQGVDCLQLLPEGTQCNPWRDSLAYVQVPRFTGCDIKINVRIRECFYEDPICGKT